MATTPKKTKKSNEKLTPAQVAALDGDNDGFAGGSKSYEVRLDEAFKEIARLQKKLESPQPKPAPLPRPTVGRIVHYYDNRDQKPLAAVVTAADGDLVSLTVFTPSGLSRSARDVPYDQDGALNGPHWRWLWL